jgi:hypothetical protein
VERDLAMAALCRRQGGAVSVAQLRQLGITSREADRLVRGGAFVRRHRGVLLDARVPATRQGQLCAALLAFGHTAFLSHRTAAAIHGLRALNLRAVEVTVTSGHTPRRAGLIGHRTRARPYPDEVTTQDGLSTSAVHRLLLELAPRETTADLSRLITEAARRRLLDHDRIVRMLSRHPHHPGTAVLTCALQSYRPPTESKSTLEDAFADWLARQSPPFPAPQRNVLLDRRYEIDFYWPEQHLVVELDGRPYHSLPDDLERDRIKDTWLQRRDIHVVRITEFRFANDRKAIQSDLRHFLRPSQAA